MSKTFEQNPGRTEGRPQDSMEGRMRDCARFSKALAKPAVRKFVFWLVCVVVLCIAALVAPCFATHDPVSADLSAVNEAPCAEYPLGTDAVGRSVLCRILYGTQTTLFAAFVIVALCFVIGSVVGALAGYVGGALDSVLMRITDAFMAFPQLVLAIAVAGLLGGGLSNAVIALAAVGWTRFARLARGQALALKERTFIQAERVGGASSATIALRHVLPNMAPPLIVTACLDLGAMMLNLAGLSFLGLGAAPPAPELGSMINQAAATFSLTPWGVFGPGAVIFVMVLVFNLFGDAANDLLAQK